MDAADSEDGSYNPGMVDAGSSTLAWRGVVAGAVALTLVLGSAAFAGRSLGRDPEPAWVCDDTRLTQLVPRGRAVVGGTVALPPGCGPR